MALMYRFLCFNLYTASKLGYGYVVFTAIFALVLRMVDLIAYTTDFEISQGFHTLWKAHFWQAFLASDIVLVFCHSVAILFSAFMILQVIWRHPIMYMKYAKAFIYWMYLYLFVEFCFSFFEFYYYRKNTFRLAFLVFVFLYTTVRFLLNILLVCILYSRYQEIDAHLKNELRYGTEKKFNQGYSYGYQEHYDQGEDYEFDPDYNKDTMY